MPPPNAWAASGAEPEDRPGSTRDEPAGDVRRDQQDDPVAECAQDTHQPGRDALVEERAGGGDRPERDRDAQACGDSGEKGGLQDQAPLPAPAPNRASTASISRRVVSVW